MEENFSFVVEKLEPNLKEQRTSANDAYLTKTELNNARESIKAGKQGSNGKIQIGQKYNKDNSNSSSDNLGGYLSGDSNEYPTFEKIVSGIYGSDKYSLQAKYFKAFEKVLKDSDKYSTEVYFFVEKNNNKYYLKTCKNFNALIQNDDGRTKFPIHFSFGDFPISNCYIYKNAENDVYIDFFNLSSFNKNNENNERKLFNLPNNSRIIYPSETCFEKNSEEIQISKRDEGTKNVEYYNDLKNLKIENLKAIKEENFCFIQRIEKIDDKEVKTLLGGFIADFNTFSNATVITAGKMNDSGSSCYKPLKIVDKNRDNSNQIIDFNLNIEKNQTAIETVTESKDYKITGVAFGLQSQNKFFSSNIANYFNSIMGLVIADSKNNNDKVRNVIEYILIKFESGNDKKIICYKINNDFDGIDKYANIYQTVISDGSIDYILNLGTKDKITHYLTNFIKINNQQSLKSSDIIFAGYNSDFINSFYSPYWADNTANNYGVDLWKDKNEFRDTEKQVKEPRSFIRYHVQITDNNGNIVNSSPGQQIYKKINWIWYNFSTDTGYYFNSSRRIDSIITNSKIGNNPNPNAILDAYETIFSLSFEDENNNLCFGFDSCNENYGISSWQDESIETVTTNGIFDKDKFANKTQAVNWLENTIRDCESIVYYDLDKKVAKGSTGDGSSRPKNALVKFYSDSIGVLTVGHGLTYNSTINDTLRKHFNQFVNELNKKDANGNYKYNYYCTLNDGQYRVRYANGDKKGQIYNSGGNGWLKDPFGLEDIKIGDRYVIGITDQEEEENYKQVARDKVAAAYDDFVLNSNLKFTIGQLVTLGAIEYNGTDNLAKAGTTKTEIVSNENGWEKFKSGVENNSNVYMHEFASNIAKFHFFKGDVNDTNSNADGKGAKSSGPGIYRYEIKCYAREISEGDTKANQITISTFWKKQLFEQVDGKYKLCNNAFNDLKEQKKGNCCLFTYLVPQYQRDEVVEAGSTGSDSGLERIKYNEVREFVEGFKADLINNSGKNSAGEIIPQDFLDVNGYYDFYSGMTPYIIAGFRDKEPTNGEYKFNYIDSITHPYFVSLKVEDNGVKTIELQLFDKDFGSYQKGIVFNSPMLDITKDVVAGKVEGAAKENINKDYSTRVYSLENLIRGALSTPSISNSGETNEGEKYQNISGKIDEDSINTFLKFSEATKYSPTNLKVRFGYADKNMYTLNKNMDYYKKKGVYTSKDKADKSRDYRWWDVTKLLEDKARILKVYKHIDNIDDEYFKNEEKDIVNTEEEQVNTAESSVAAAVKENSGDQTTKMSYFIDCMITGYKTSLQNNGILYTITAVETKEARLMKTRFLQRFATINSYPEEVLYILMKLFNENSEGKNVTACPIKLYIVGNTEAPKGFEYELVQQLDLSKLSDVDKNGIKADITSTGEINTIQLAQKNNIIKPEWLKTINLNFGGQAALTNYAQFYKNDQKTPSIYKNVYSLLNEFCAACPPFVVPREQYTTTNINGEQVTIESVPEAQRRLSWFSCNVKNKYIAVFFYYRKPEKVRKIRRYTWGPENTEQTVITSLSIENANEFAVLSGVESFNGETSKIELRTAEGTVFKRNEDGNRDARTRTFDSATDSITSGKNYEVALASCMYKGSIQIMGDPFYLFFGANMQPCTYPIYLRVLVPKSEFERRAYDINGEDYNAITEQKDIFGERGTFGNQQLHEMSGYYVINKITHNISTSGFTTTLEVMSYPGIVNDVVDKNNCSQNVKNTFKTVEKS